MERKTAFKMHLINTTDLLQCTGAALKFHAIADVYNYLLRLYRHIYAHVYTYTSFHV